MRKLARNTPFANLRPGDAISVRVIVGEAPPPRSDGIDVHFPNWPGERRFITFDDVIGIVSLNFTTGDVALLKGDRGAAETLVEVLAIHETFAWVRHQNVDWPEVVLLADLERVPATPATPDTAEAAS